MHFTTRKVKWAMTSRDMTVAGSHLWTLQPLNSAQDAPPTNSVLLAHSRPGPHARGLCVPAPRLSARHVPPVRATPTSVVPRTVSPVPVPMPTAELLDEPHHTTEEPWHASAPRYPAPPGLSLYVSCAACPCKPCCAEHACGGPFCQDTRNDLKLEPQPDAGAVSKYSSTTHETNEGDGVI